jgi:hypothetical protein
MGDIRFLKGFKGSQIGKKGHCNRITFAGYRKREIARRWSVYFEFGTSLVRSKSFDLLSCLCILLLPECPIFVKAVWLRADLFSDKL